MVEQKVLTLPNFHPVVSTPVPLSTIASGWYLQNLSVHFCRAAQPVDGAALFDVVTPLFSSFHLNAACQALFTCIMGGLRPRGESATTPSLGSAYMGLEQERVNVAMPLRYRQ